MQKNISDMSMYLEKIFNSTIDNSNMAVHQLTMKLGGQLVSVRTDCAVVQNPTGSVEYGKGIGCYHEVQGESLC